MHFWGLRSPGSAFGGRRPPAAVLLLCCCCPPAVREGPSTSAPANGDLGGAASSTRRGGTRLCPPTGPQQKHPAEQTPHYPRRLRSPGGWRGPRLRCQVGCALRQRPPRAKFSGGRSGRRGAGSPRTPARCGPARVRVGWNGAWSFSDRNTLRVFCTCGGGGGGWGKQCNVFCTVADARLLLMHAMCCAWWCALCAVQCNILHIVGCTVGLGCAVRPFAHFCTAWGTVQHGSELTANSHP